MAFVNCPPHQQLYSFEPVHHPANLVENIPPPPSARSSNSYRRSDQLDDDHEHRPSHDSKPRLGKEQQEILERHFQGQPKPSTSTKRGFAQDLNVPIEKINNWFQNRRAKVKQDAKKQQGEQLNLFFNNSLNRSIPASVEAFSSGFIDSSFYQNSALQVSGTSLASNVQSLHIPGILVPSNHCEPLQLNHSTVDEVNNGANFSLEMVEPTINDSPDVFNAFFGLESEDMYAGQNQYIDYQTMSAFSKQFNQNEDQFAAFEPLSMDFEPYSTSTTTSLFTRSSHDSSSIGLNSLPIDEHRYRYSSSTTDLSIPRSRSSRIPDRDDLNRIWPFMAHGHMHSGSEAASSDRSSAFIQMQSTQQQAPPQLNQSQIPNQPNQFEQAANPSNVAEQPQNQMNYNPAPVEEASTDQNMTQPTVYEHRESIASNLSDPAQNADLKTGSARPMLPFKHPAASSSLAARRQRRPATLGSAALRSASFNCGPSTTSPTTAQSLTPDMKLRRIQSTTGVTTGRIQKPNMLPQRSPLYMTFNEASEASSQPSRPMSTTPRMPNFPQSAYSTTSTAPPTPMSPFDTDESMHWSQTPNSAGLSQMLGSPPATPMEASQMAMLCLDSTPRSHQPPHSAPAWQQTFHIMPPQYSEPMPQHIPISHPHQPVQNPFFRPATAGESVDSIIADTKPFLNSNPAQGVAPSNQQGFTSPQVAPVQVKPESPQQKARSGSTPHTFFSMQNTFSRESPAKSPSLKASSASPPKTPSDLVIHEYAPREPADPATLPPRSKGPQPPTNYTFHNQHPENFSSP